MGNEINIWLGSSVRWRWGQRSAKDDPFKTLESIAAALAWDAIHFSFKERESGPGPSHPARVYLKERREKSLSNIGIVNLYANEAERRNCQSSRSCFFIFFFLF